jgi:ankyrin repeat protein
MSDDLQLSPETAALAALAGSVINATLDRGLAGDLEGFDADVDAAMAEARPAFQDEDAARRDEMLALTKRAMRIFSEIRRAMKEGRHEDVAHLDAELSAGKRRVSELTAYQGFTAAAERLHRAKGFDDFMAALPQVDLSRLYGSGNFKISPFPLIWAVEARDKALERVQALLNAGARLDLTTQFERLTVLHWIAQSRRKGRDKRLAILRLLVLKGADLEARDRFGRTPLHVAITQGSVEDLALFLDAGADARAIVLNPLPFPHERAEVTTLMMAADDPDKMQLLLDHGADPAQRCGDGWDLLSHLHRQLAEAEQWLMERPEKKRAGSTYERLRDARAASLALIEPRLPARPSPARKLTYREAPELFHALQGDLALDAWRDTLAKVEVTTYHAPNGDHPIYWPIRARTDRAQKLWLMLQAGASVQGDPGNGTALHIFAQTPRRDAAEQAQIVRMLLQAGADLDAVDYGGLTPLVRAVEYGGLHETAALLQARAEARGPDGPPPRLGRLLRSAEGKPRMFRLLLDNGAYPPPGSATRRGVDRRLAEEIEELGGFLKEALSDNQRRETERRLRGCRACQEMLAARDAAT